MRAVTMMAAAVLVGPTVSAAQVLEIGAGGEVTTYSGPTVFTAKGAEPIDLGRRRAGTRAGRISRGREDIARAAGAAALSPDLVAAVAWRESGFRPTAVSRAGALGEMQLMPATARSLRVDPRDPGQNLDGGAAYLRAMMQRYDGDVERALAAYNAGPGAVDRYGGVPPYRETQAYVASIMDRLSTEALADTSPTTDEPRPDASAGGLRTTR